MPLKKPQSAALTALLVVGFLVLAVPLLGGLEPARAQQEEYDVRFVLEDWAELNMNMQEGGTIVWSMATEGQQEIYLDLHSHAGGQEEFHERFESTSNEAGEFTAERDGAYGFFLQSDGEEDVTVRLQVRGDFEIDGEPKNIEPLGDSNGAPGPGLLLVLVALATGAGMNRRRHEANAAR